MLWRVALRLGHNEFMTPTPSARTGCGHALREHSSLVFVGAIAFGLTLAAVAGALTVAPPDPGRRDVADLPETTTIPERKRVFLEFLRPVVQVENQRVLAQRERVLAALRTLEAGDRLSPWSKAWLDGMAARYGVDASEPLQQARALAMRVDIVPASLVLAQAALESGWGRSRFAREANNLFGEWCFSPGCGVVPAQRPADRTYEVAAFDGVGASVRSYLDNLNTHPAYEDMRRIRSRLRQAGEKLDGHDLAAGLSRYAAIGEQSVERVRNVIRRNDLDQTPPAS